jgi:hypothetical protein
MDLLDHDSQSNIYILLPFNTKGDRALLTWGRNKFLSGLPTPLSSIRLHLLRNYRIPLIMSPSPTEVDHPQENPLDLQNYQVYPMMSPSLAESDHHQENPSNRRNYQVPLIMTSSLTENHHPQANPSNLRNYQVPLIMSSSLTENHHPQENPSNLRNYGVPLIMRSSLTESHRPLENLSNRQWSHGIPLEALHHPTLVPKHKVCPSQHTNPHGTNHSIPTNLNGYLRQEALFQRDTNTLPHHHLLKVTIYRASRKKKLWNPVDTIRVIRKVRKNFARNDTPLFSLGKWVVKDKLRRVYSLATNQQRIREKQLKHNPTIAELVLTNTNLRMRMADNYLSNI